MTQPATGRTHRQSGRSGRGGRGGQLVPDAEFTSYYGRPVVKPSPWEADIPAYFFLGGLAGASSLLAVGSDASGRAALRRSSRVTAAGAVGLSFAALVHDLGRPARFHHMLRVAKGTSPMSVGTWLLTAYAPMAGVAAASEARDLLPPSLRNGLVGKMLPTLGRLGGIGAATLGPAIASYTAVLIGDTATPTWHASRYHLPFLFVSSAAAAAVGWAWCAARCSRRGRHAGSASPARSSRPVSPRSWNAPSACRARRTTTARRAG